MTAKAILSALSVLTILVGRSVADDAFTPQIVPALPPTWATTSSVGACQPASTVNQSTVQAASVTSRTTPRDRRNARRLYRKARRALWSLLGTTSSFQSSDYLSGPGDWHAAPTYFNLTPWVAPVIVNHAIAPRSILNPMTHQYQMMSPGQWVAAPPGSPMPYVWQAYAVWPLFSPAPAQTTGPIINYFHKHKPIRTIIGKVIVDVNKIIHPPQPAPAPTPVPTPTSVGACAPAACAQSSCGCAPGACSSNVCAPATCAPAACAPAGSNASSSVFVGRGRWRCRRGL